MSSVLLTWNISTGATSYRVYRSTTQGARGNQILSSVVPTATDTTPAAGTNYWYGVTAVNTNGESALSLQAGVSIPSNPVPPPGEVQRVPPLVSVTNSDGTWTIGPGTTIYLNGAPTNGSGNQIMLVGDTIFVLGGDNNWYQWMWLPTGVQGQLAVKGYRRMDLPTTDPSTYIIATPPTYVGPSNTPTLWSLDPTSFAVLTAQATYAIAQPFNGEYLTGSDGIPYMRFTNDPALDNGTYQNDASGCALLAWFFPLHGSFPTPTEYEAANIRYMLWIEDDVETAFREIGMKLPGLDNYPLTVFPTSLPALSWRTKHSEPMDNTYLFQDYIFNAETTSYTNNYPVGNLRTGQWYCIEQRIVLNTFTGPTPNHDGYGAMWMNGNKIFEASNFLWRDDPANKLCSLFLDVFHGGRNRPLGIMHYRIAKLAASESYIGVPSELVNYPAWRTSMTTVDSVYQILNTANMAGNMPATTGGRPVVGFGKSALDFAAWSGMAADGTSWWGMANGGDYSQWSNKVFRVDFTQSQPQYNLVYHGTTEAVVTADKAANWDGPYYSDGSPQAAQTYYTLHRCVARNYIFRVAASAVWTSSHKFSAMTGFNIAANVYDPAGTWPDSGLNASGLVPSIAKHPTTEDIWGTWFGDWHVWSQSTGLWTQFTQNTTQWGYHAMVIDASRNRLVYLECGPTKGGIIEFMDMTTHTYSAASLTGAGAAGLTTDAYAEHCVLVHDLDNDRYLFFGGNSNPYSSNPGPYPGVIYAINPTTHAATKVADIVAPINGWNNRVAYFHSFGGVAFVPAYEYNIFFMPTR